MPKKAGDQCGSKNARSDWKKCDGVLETFWDEDGDLCLKCNKCGIRRYSNLLSNTFCVEES